LHTTGGEGHRADAGETRSTPVTPCARSVDCSPWSAPRSGLGGRADRWTAPSTPRRDTWTTAAERGRSGPGGPGGWVSGVVAGSQAALRCCRRRAGTRSARVSVLSPRRAATRSATSARAQLASGTATSMIIQRVRRRFRNAMGSTYPGCGELNRGGSRAGLSARRTGHNWVRRSPVPAFPPRPDEVRCRWPAHPPGTCSLTTIEVITSTHAKRPRQRRGLSLFWCPGDLQPPEALAGFSCRRSTASYQTG